ncbi:MAG: replication-associated recombination protein A, partial [Armatimonadota bacterium]
LGRQDAEGYLYPHDFPGGYVAQEYVPTWAKSRPYYEPTDRGREKRIRARLEALRRMQRASEDEDSE